MALVDRSRNALVNSPLSKSPFDENQAAGRAKVRGRAFLAVTRSVESLRGPNALRGVLVRLQPELANNIENKRLSADAWYAIGWYKELLSAVAETTHEGNDLVRVVGAECARQDMKGPFQFVAKLLRPETLFSGAMRLFKTYYDTGEVWVAGAATGHAQAIWKECHGFDRNMWTEVQGSAEAILEFGGARRLKVQVIAGGGNGDSHMELRAHWHRR